MGWWTSDDATGLIGDRPADILGGALEDALGPRFDRDLLGGFLSALGAALLRDPARLVAEGAAVAALAIAIEVGDDPPDIVPIRRAEDGGGLEDALFDALEAVAFQYLASGPERLPRLSEVLETLAFTARGHLMDPETGDDLPLHGIRPAPAGQARPPTPREAAATLRWAGIRALLAGGVPDDAARALVGAALQDEDWRVRMTALLTVGRHRLAPLARRAAATAVPEEAEGLREDDRRALLALRDVAAVRAAGAEAPERPIHPDAVTAARRGALLAAVRAAILGEAAGAEAAVLQALAAPEAARRDPRLPAAWRRWLG